MRRRGVGPTTPNQSTLFNFDFTALEVRGGVLRSGPGLTFIHVPVCVRAAGAAHPRKHNDRGKRTLGIGSAVRHAARSRRLESTRLRPGHHRLADRVTPPPTTHDCPHADSGRSALPVPAGHLSSSLPPRGVPAHQAGALRVTGNPAAAAIHRRRLQPPPPSTAALAATRTATLATAITTIAAPPSPPPSKNLSILRLLFLFLYLLFSFPQTQRLIKRENKRTGGDFGV